MTPEQFATFLKSNEKATGAAIEKFVNGKIRAIDTKLSEHIKRVEPVIEAYEETSAENRVGKRYGNRLIWLSGVTIALGVLYGAVHLFLTSVITWKP